MDGLDAECMRCAEEVIGDLLDHGHDYTAKRDDIARLFRDDLFKGNWDSTTDFGDDAPDLRLIQEDEYDQHMDGDARPEYITFSAGHYVMLA